MKLNQIFATTRTNVFGRAIALAFLFVLSGVQTLRAHDHPVPWEFKAITTVVWEKADPTDPTLSTEIHVGSGHWGHLGAVSVVVVNQVQQVVDPQVGPALSISGPGIVTNSEGDSLSFTVTTLVPYHPPDFPFHAQIVITGGTGKLAGVTGNGQGGGFVDTSGAFHFDAIGTMILDHH